MLIQRCSLRALLIILVLGGAVLAASRPQGFVVDGPGAVAHSLPADTLAHVSLRGEPLGEHGKHLAIAKILEMPEMQQALRPLRDVVQGGLRNLAERLRETSGIELSQLLDLFDGGATISLLGLPTLEHEGRNVIRPDLLVTVEVGNRGETVRAMLTSLEKLALEKGIGSAITVEFAGSEGRCIDLPSNPYFQEVCYAMRGGRLWLSNRREVLARAFERGGPGKGEKSLGKSAVFQEVHRQVVRPKSILTVYADVERLVSSFRTHAPPEVQELIPMFGVDAISAMGYGLDLDGPGLRDRLYVHVPSTTGILAAHRMETAKARVHTHELVPADTGLFIAQTIALQPARDLLLQALEQSSPRMGEAYRRLEAYCKSELGFDVRDELLASLGPEYALYVSWPGRAIIPDVGLLIQVKNRTKIDHIFRDLQEALAQVMRVKTVPYEGHDIRYLDFNQPLSLETLRGGMGRAAFLAASFKPSLTFVGDYLLVTIWPQSAKNLIRGLKNKTPRLSDRPDFTQLLRRLRVDNPEAGSTALMYMDVQGLAGFVLDNGLPLAQSLLPSHWVPIDFPAFPVTSETTEHLFGLISAGHWTKEGSYSEFYSPTGMLPTYAVMVGAFAAVLIRTVVVSPKLQAVPIERFESSEDKAMRAQGDLMAIKEALRVFSMTEGRLPGEDEWLSVLLDGTKSHPGSFLPRGLLPDDRPIDPWGRPYRYTVRSPRSVSVSSLGADGKEGGVGANADFVVMVVQVNR